MWFCVCFVVLLLFNVSIEQIMVKSFKWTYFRIFLNSLSFTQHTGYYWRFEQLSEVIKITTTFSQVKKIDIFSSKQSSVCLRYILQHFPFIFLTKGFFSSSLLFQSVLIDWSFLLLFLTYLILFDLVSISSSFSSLCMHVWSIDRMNEWLDKRMNELMNR